MKRKINKGLILTAALAIVATLLLTAAVCYRTFQNQVLEDLKGYAGIISHSIAGEREEPLIEGKEIFGRLGLRVTLVGKDGTVLYDTLADAEDMENHGSRPEIESAFTDGEGSIIRQSDTRNENTYYYAVRLDGGQVLRVSRNADSIYRILKDAVPYLLVIVLFLFIVCCISSYFLAEGLIRPIRLIAQDVEQIEGTEAYEELKPYVDAIKSRNDEVMQNARMRQEFTANVSHELKTPLTAVSGYSELIENGMVTSDEEIRRFAREIHSNAGRLLTLINDVIRLSELDADDMEELLVPVNLKEITEACVNILQVNAGKHGIKLVFKGENVFILSTRQMTEEIVNNLCDNAIRYNKEGGSVYVTVEDRLDTAVLIVRDTGIGIPREHQERIFERFYRVDKSRSKSTGGTGLGLAIVKHILLRLGAFLRLDSEEGKGTEITITFQAVCK